MVSFKKMLAPEFLSSILPILAFLSQRLRFRCFDYYFKRFDSTRKLSKAILIPTETLKKLKFFEKKMQKFQVFGKNCKKFKYLEIIAIFVEKIAKIS